MRLVAGAVLLAIAACASATTRPVPLTYEPHERLLGATQQPSVAYGTASPAQTIALYRPRKGKPPYPVVLRLDGRAEDTAANAIVDAGYALALVHYRTAPEAPFPAGPKDVKDAVRFLRQNAARLDLDPAQFIAWGWGQGGWYAVMLGVTGDQPTPFDSTRSSPTSSAVEFVVDWAGPVDYATLDRDLAAYPAAPCIQTYQRHGIAGSPESTWLCGDRDVALTDPSCAAAVRDANLLTYLSKAKKLPGFYIAHGADDCVIAWRQSEQLIEALEQREQAPTFHRMSRASHDDARFELEESARSLAAIDAWFHPDAAAKQDDL